MTTTTVTQQTDSFGALLRGWRQRRHLSQLELSAESGISSRHLSFLETGRASPSREMVLRLAEWLDVPLRERNTLLTAAGYAPTYRCRPVNAPEMAAVNAAIQTILNGHEPNPAIALDRYWNITMTNRAAGMLTAGVPEHLLVPTANAYRISLHPDGLAGRIVNFAEFARSLLARLRHDVAVSADPELTALLAEVQGYAMLRNDAPVVPERGAVVLPMRLRSPDGPLSFFTTITTIGTPVDITVAELAIETFFPADEATARKLGELAAR
jgi:transcriptional regulator with XRE-family HTH domain